MQTKQTFHWKLFTTLLVLFLLLSVSLPFIYAQETINLDEIKIGNISAEQPAASYFFTTPDQSQIEITVLAVSAGLAPQFSVFNQGNALVQATGNPNLAEETSGTVTLPQAGTYRIEVTSVTNSVGQFVLDVQNAAPSIPPIPVTENQEISGVLAGGQSLIFGINGNPASPLSINIAFTGIVRVELTDTTGAVNVAGSGPLQGYSFRLAQGQEQYRLVLANESSGNPANYQLLLSTTSGFPAAGVPTPVTTEEPVPGGTPELPTLPETGTCVLATRERIDVNIRNGPSLDSQPFSAMDPFETYTVVGRVPDNSWYQIDSKIDGRLGWVARSVTRLGGDCSNVLITLVPTPTPTPSPTPTITPTPRAIISTPPIIILTPLTGYEQLNAACATQYGEHTFAHPFNGGCYTCPLNSTPLFELGSGLPTMTCLTRDGADVDALLVGFLQKG